VVICTTQVSPKRSDGKAGQTIAFGVNQPIKGSVIKMLAQRERATNFSRKNAASIFAPAWPAAYRDQALGIEIA